MYASTTNILIIWENWKKNLLRYFNSKPLCVLVDSVRNCRFFSLFFTNDHECIDRFAVESTTELISSSVSMTSILYNISFRFLTAAAVTSLACSLTFFFSLFILTLIWIDFHLWALTLCWTSAVELTSLELLQHSQSKLNAC